MTNKTGLHSPIFFISISFAIGVLNFLDTFARLMYSFMVRMRYPLEVYLKPIFFLVQVVSLIMFIRSVRFVQQPVVSDRKLSRFFAAQVVLTVVVILLYVDFQLSALTGMNAANVFLQFAFYLTYLVALSGTSFWFASELLNGNRWRWLTIVFVLTGLAYITAFLEPMFFWSQNYLGLVFPSQLALVGTYASHILMFLAAMSAIFIIVWQTTAVKNSPRALVLALLLLVLAFFIPLVWDGYKEGLINFVIRDVFYWGFGYSGLEWYSVSFYLMSIVAYIITWRLLSKRSDQTLAFSLIVLGVASFPWNGVTPLRAGYSSIPGNVISLISIITGASLLKTRRATK